MMLLFALYLCTKSGWLEWHRRGRGPLYSIIFGECNLDDVKGCRNPFERNHVVVVCYFFLPFQLQNSQRILFSVVDKKQTQKSGERLSFINCLAEHKGGGPFVFFSSWLRPLFHSFGWLCMPAPVKRVVVLSFNILFRYLWMETKQQKN